MILWIPKSVTIATASTEASSMDSNEPYDVEDKYTDPQPPADSWSQFLSVRFRKRRGWYDGLNDKEQRLVRKEMKRIEYFRKIFQDRKILGSDRDPLVARLKDARATWNRLAFLRCETELSRCTAIGNDRSCRILTQVLRRGGDILADDHFIVFADKDDEKNPAGYSEDDRDYGHNGRLMLFKNGENGAEMDDQHCSGKFPHQKIEIQHLLHNEEVKLLKRTDDKNDLRYFHLPANNMAWAEVGRVPPAAPEMHRHSNLCETSEP